jgi:fructosamine-3-kinase
LPQQNTPARNGATFFVESRLRPQAERARLASRIGADTMKRLDRFFETLPAWLPDEPPALLHGDLWSGNFMTGPGGGAWLIDPAVYYGFREADLAMSLLFGGFDPAFYEGYAEVFPPAPGWRERVDGFNLYPLLVHVNLFGGGYAAQVASIVKRYT